VLRAFDGYWGGRPNLDGIVFHIVPDQTVQALELEKNQLQLIEAPGTQASSLKTAGGVNLYAGPPATGYVLAMNVNASGGDVNAPLRNVLVRQAIFDAINRTAIIQAVESGYGVPAITMVTPASQFWNASLKTVADGGNIALAKQLLAQAGYSNGLQLNMLVSPYLNFDKMGTVIQQNLKQIGITVSLTDEDFGIIGHQLLTHSPQWQLSVHDLFLPTLVRINDYYNSRNAVPFAFNLQTVNDNTLDGLLSQMINGSQDSHVLQGVVNQVQQRILSQAYGAWLYYPIRNFATTSNVVGYKPHQNQYYQLLVYQPLIGLNTTIVQSRSAAASSPQPIIGILEPEFLASFVTVAVFAVTISRFGGMLEKSLQSFFRKLGQRALHSAL